MADTLVVPLSSGPKTNYVRDPKKPDSKKSILELFFDAQYDIQQGVQPPICIKNSVLIQHLGQRTRAPTTWETIQDGINKKSDVHKRAQEIETGDFSDDEEDDDELSSVQCPPSPNSQAGSPHGDEESTTFSTLANTNSPRFTKPKPKGKSGKKKRINKISLDEPVDGSVTNSTNSFAHKTTNSASMDSYNNNNNNNNKYAAIPESSVSTTTFTNNNNNNNNNDNNNNDSSGVDTSTFKHSALSPRTRQQHSKMADKSVSDLWFQAQAELSEGKQPKICKYNGVKLDNVRIHVAKYANHAKRNSRVSPQDFLNVHLSKPRKSIAADDDEDDELTDNDIELSNSKSADNITPTSKS